MLLAVATDSDNNLESSTAVSAPVITKEAILELYMFCKSNPSCTYYTLWKWLACLFKDKWSEESFPTIKSVRQSVLQIVFKVSKLRKMPTTAGKETAIVNYLGEVYTLLKVFTNTTTVMFII